MLHIQPYKLNIQDGSFKVEYLLYLLSCTHTLKNIFLQI